MDPSINEAAGCFHEYLVHFIIQHSSLKNSLNLDFALAGFLVLVLGLISKIWKCRGIICSELNFYLHYENLPFFMLFLILLG